MRVPLPKHCSPLHFSMRRQGCTTACRRGWSHGGRGVFCRLGCAADLVLLDSPHSREGPPGETERELGQGAVTRERMVKKAVAVQVSLCVRNGTASVCYIKGQMQGRDFSLGRESGGSLRGFEGCSGAEMGKKPSEWGNWGSPSPARFNAGWKVGRFSWTRELVEALEGNGLAEAVRG